jgi:UDP-N-acetylglucosamine 1-carboxyvinyltransferase
MDKILIKGGAKLSGSVRISGAKNSALPIIFSTLLVKGSHRIENLPDLADVNYALKILEELGAKCTFNKDESYADIEIPENLEPVATYDLVRKMRASILVLGPLLARFGHAKVSLPGGCAIGTRPIDLHLKALEQMAAKITVSEGYVTAKSAKLQGAKIFFSMPTVGGTENIMMAAALAKGETVLENAAREPEIVDLGNYLIKMGAEISGLGTSTIVIKGAEKLKAPKRHAIIPDRIEAGTFVVAGLMTRSDIVVEGAKPEHLKAFFDVIDEAGGVYELDGDSIKVWGSKHKELKPVQVKTAPHPGFPTDLQAQVMTLMTQAKGVSFIEEDIFENRFMHVQELARLGAEIKTNSKVAQVFGPSKLTGAPVMATDLRASASLVVAGLVATGETEINRIYHLDRGYEKIESKISGLNGQIKRLK